MTATYTTATLAAEILPDAAEANIKTATRTLRKFLRDDMGAGKAVVGKGGRYALELKAAELRAMKKRFAAWEIAQEEAKAARAAALEAARTPAAVETAPEPVETDIEDNEPEGDNGPTDEEIAAMLSDDEEVDTED